MQSQAALSKDDEDPDDLALRLEAEMQGADFPDPQIDFHDVRSDCSARLSSRHLGLPGHEFCRVCVSGPQF